MLYDEEQARNRFTLDEFTTGKGKIPPKGKNNNEVKQLETIKTLTRNQANVSMIKCEHGTHISQQNIGRAWINSKQLSIKLPAHWLMFERQHNAIFISAICRQRTLMLHRW